MKALNSVVQRKMLKIRGENGQMSALTLQQIYEREKPPLPSSAATSLTKIQEVPVVALWRC
jgi:hypothetical protein